MLQPKRRLFDSLTGIRALGSWWVVAFHMDRQLAYLIPVDSFLMRVVHVGHVSITLFFILSGFVISYNYTTRFQNLRLNSYLQFLWQRLARIYPIHIVMLLVLLSIVLLSRVGGFGLGNPERYTVGSFFEHFLLVNAWQAPFKTTWNGVAWTLSLEWLCYLIFPIIAFAACRIRNPVKLFSCLVVLLLCTSVVRLAVGMPELLLQPTAFVEYWRENLFELIRHPSLFTLGFLMYCVYAAQVGANWKWQYLNPILLFVLVIVSVLQSSLGLSTLFVTPFWAALIYGLTWDHGFIAKFFQSKFMMQWGYMSYALFMTHTVTLTILNKVLPFEKFAEGNILSAIALFSLYIIFISLVAWVAYTWIEEPCRMWMKSRVDQFKRHKKSA